MIEEIRMQNKMTKMKQKNRSYFLIKQTKEIEENVTEVAIKLKNKNDQFHFMQIKLDSTRRILQKNAMSIQMLNEKITDMKQQYQELLD